VSRPTEKAEPEAIIPMEIVSSGDQSATTTTTTTVRLCRKAASRTEPLYLRRGTRQRQVPRYFASLQPQDEDEDIPARKKRRLEEPPPTTPDEATRETASPDVSEGRSPADEMDNSDYDDDDDEADAESMTDTQPNAGATARWTLEEDAKLTSAVTNTSKKKIGKEYKRDWVAVAVLVPGRTRGQCYYRWRDALDPSIDRANARLGKWTAVEDSKLKDAVQMHGDNDWVAITALVSSRTKRQCMNRWHNALNPSIALTAGSKGKWTLDEDSKLKDAVQMHNGKNWIAIAVLVPFRTKIQCMNRWHDVVDPNIGGASGRTGKWTEDEDSKLKDAVQLHGGKDWVVIAALVQGRTGKQCYSRWHDFLKHSIDGATGRTGRWTGDEDNKLKNAVKWHVGKGWGAISALVPGRTPKQCNKRWKDVLDPTRL
jgi:hypothetical protein